MNYELTCPHCNKDIDIYVEVESHSDYYFEDCCPECNKKITTFKNSRGKTLDLAMEIMGEVSDGIAGAAEFAADLLNNR